MRLCVLIEKGIWVGVPFVFNSSFGNCVDDEGDAKLCAYSGQPWMKLIYFIMCAF